MLEGASDEAGLSPRDRFMIDSPLGTEKNGDGRITIFYVKIFRFLSELRDGASVWKWWVHEKPDLPVAFHKRRTREFGGESGGPPQKKWIGDWRKCSFPLFWGACLHSVFLESLLKIFYHGLNLFPHPLTISMQGWTNCETRIFKKCVVAILYSVHTRILCWSGLACSEGLSKVQNRVFRQFPQLLQFARLAQLL